MFLRFDPNVTSARIAGHSFGRLEGLGGTTKEKNVDEKLMNMRYVYIFEDGQIGCAQEEPTPNDLESVVAGVLDILRFDPLGAISEYDPLMKDWVEVKRAKLARHWAGRYHYL